MSKMKKIIALFCVFIMLFTIGFSSIYATENRDKLDEIEQGINDTQEQIDANNKTADELLKDIEAYDEEMETLQVDIDKYETEKVAVEEDLEKAKLELDEAVKKKQESQELLEDRLSVMYMYGNIGYLELIFDSESFSELISRVVTIQSLISYDRDIIEALEKAQSEIEIKKKEIEDKNNELADILDELTTKQGNLDSLREKRETALGVVNEDTAKLKELLEKEEAEADELRQLIMEESGGGDYANSVLAWPIPGRSNITSPYGWRTHPIFGDQRFHAGVDVGAWYGDTIVSPGNGVITYAGTYGGYGKTVIIDLGLIDGKKISVLLAHNDSIHVSVGQKVTKGQLVSKAGSTGWSTGPHLHFEVHVNGSTVNPLTYTSP